MKLILLNCCLFLITSCDFQTGMTGKVIDKDTGKPISGAIVNLLEGLDIKKTNKDGYFEVYKQTGGHKVDPVIVVSKNGYKPFQIKISYSDEENSYSIKTETKYIQYKDTLFLNSDKSSFVLGVDIEKWSQDFTVGDTLIIYLTKKNINREIEEIKRNLKSQE